VATAALAEGAELYTVPENLVITGDLVRKSKHRVHAALAKLTGRDDDALIALFLVYERARGAGSTFAPYFAVLPTNVPNLGTFSRAELEGPQGLQDEAFAQEVASRSALAEKFWEGVQGRLGAVWADAFAGGIASPGPPSLADYTWARSLVDSRGLRFTGKTHLAPLACMMNYKPHPDSRKAASGKFFLKHHTLDPATGALTISTDRATPAGAQVFEDYGDNEDKIYAEFHGFVPNVNPFRCVDVSVPGIGFAHPRRGLKTKTLRGLGLGWMSSTCIGSGAGVPLDGTVLEGADEDEEETSVFALQSGMAAYVSVMAMNDDELSACDVAIAGQGAPLGENMEALPSAVDAACGVSSTANFLRRLMDGDTRDAPAVPATVDAWNVAAHGKKVPRFDRQVNALVGIFAHSYTSARASTTLAADLSDHQTLVGKGAAATPDDERRLLALRFRMAHKSTWQALVTSYGFSWAAFEGLVQAHADVPEDPATGEALWGVDAPLATQLSEFNAWFNAACEEAGTVNKLAAAEIPGFRVGTVAVADIAAEELYIEVPNGIIMDSAKALSSSSGVAPLIHRLRKAYNRADPFVELMLLLIYERLVAKEAGEWWPYLRMLPTPSQLDIPPMWTRENPSRQALEQFHSYSVRGIDQYANKNMQTFPRLAAVPQLKQFFATLPGVFTEETYIWAATILDSRRYPVTAATPVSLTVLCKSP
jgi:hypothetical protein